MPILIPFHRLLVRLLAQPTEHHLLPQPPQNRDAKLLIRPPHPVQPQSEEHLLARCESLVWAD